MSGTVIVIGAGATLSQAIDFRPSQTREHPPLDANFFDATKKLAGHSAPLKQQVDQLRSRIVASALFPDPFGQSTRSLEECFADIYYEVAVGEKAEAVSVFISLLRLYNRVLAQTTNWVSARSKLAGFGKLLRQELERSSDPVTIITFNQDLLAENVVNRLPRSEGTWCLRCLYDGAPLEFMESARALFPISRACGHQPRVRLLKLHGSLNWFVRTRDADPSKSALFPSGKKKVWAHAGGQVRVSLRQRWEHGVGRQNWYLWPVVIPPIYDKQRLTRLSVIEQAWGSARDAVASTSKLIIWGYSLPDADIIATQMLRRAFRENQEVMEIYCVNPDHAVTGKLHERLGADVVHLYRDLDYYLADGNA